MLLLLNECLCFYLGWEYGASKETIKPLHTPHPIHLDLIHQESTKQKKTININVSEMKRPPIQISMAMERGEVTKIQEIAEAEMPQIPG